MNEVTVVVPCYNCEHTIQTCVHSLLNQTKPVNIILVDDGSLDGTARIVDEFCKEYPNIQGIHKKNAGLPQARKSGIDITQTRYVGFVDSDDWVEPTMFEELYSSIQQEHTSISCCELYFEFQTQQIPTFPPPKLRSPISYIEALAFLHQHKAIYPYMCNKLFLTDLFKAVNFPDSNFVGEDYATLIQILPCIDNVSLVGHPLYHYVQSVGSMSKSGFGSAHQIAYEKYNAEMHELIGQFPSLSVEIQNYMQTEFLSFIVAMSRNLVIDCKMASEIMQFTRKNLRSYLLAPYVEWKYKISALACSLHYECLIRLYRTFIK